jgi:Holliday junction DNA helicase RuvA
MIARLTGQLEMVGENRAVIAAGPLAYEVMVSPVTADELRPRIGQTVTLYTLDYFDGNPAHGQQMSPRLVGFMAETEKRFFLRYISVQGIGIAKGLRSLVLPIARIAQAIESRNVEFLQELPGIGERTAEKMIAELRGRLDEFAVTAGGRPPAEEPESKREAVVVLLSLGLQRPEASARVDAAYERLGDKATVEALVREAFHQGPAAHGRVT